VELQEHHALAFDVLHELCSKNYGTPPPSLVSAVAVVSKTISNKQKLLAGARKINDIKPENLLRSSNLIGSDITKLLEITTYWLNKKFYSPLYRSAYWYNGYSISVTQYYMEELQVSVFTIYKSNYT